MDPGAKLRLGSVLGLQAESQGLILFLFILSVSGLDDYKVCQIKS